MPARRNHEVSGITSAQTSATAAAVTTVAAAAAAAAQKEKCICYKKLFCLDVELVDSAIYSNSAENSKRPKNLEDSSDLDENLTETIAAMRSIISKIFVTAWAQKNRFRFFFVRMLDC